MQARRRITLTAWKLPVVHITRTSALAIGTTHKLLRAVVQLCDAIVPACHWQRVLVPPAPHFQSPRSLSHVCYRKTCLKKAKYPQAEAHGHPHSNCFQRCPHAPHCTFSTTPQRPGVDSHSNFAVLAWAGFDLKDGLGSAKLPKRGSKDDQKC